MVFQVGQKGKTTEAATEVGGSLVMNQGPVRLLGMLLLWCGDATCVLDGACDLMTQLRASAPGFLNAATLDLSEATRWR